MLRRLVSEGILYLANRLVAYIPSHVLRLVYYRKVMGFNIGAGSAILMGNWFDCREGFTMGDHSVINQNCRLDGRGGITIGDNVSISADTCILTADHDLQSPTFAGRTRPVAIESYAFIGTRATILPGVRIGRGAVVGAGAVVTKDVEPFKIVAGSPARIIGERTRDLAYQLDYRRLFA